jgi:hypothetical protein
MSNNLLAGLIPITKDSNLESNGPENLKLETSVCQSYNFSKTSSNMRCMTVVLQFTNPHGHHVGVVDDIEHLRPAMFAQISWRSVSWPVQ